MPTDHPEHEAVDGPVGRLKPGEDRSALSFGGDLTPLNGPGQLARSAWLNIRFTVGHVEAVRDLVGGDLAEAMLLCAISDANVSHLDGHPDLTRRHLAIDAAFSDAMLQPAYVTDLAQHLGLRWSDARNAIRSLVERNLVAEHSGGFLLPSSVLAASETMPSLTRQLSGLDDLIGGLGSIRALGLNPRAEMQKPFWPIAWAAARLANTHFLATMALTRDLATGQTLAARYILLAIGLASGATLRLSNTSQVGAVSPRTGPVHGATLAAGLDLTEDTVAESLQTLRASGLIVRSSRGDDLLFEDASLVSWRAFEYRSQALTRTLIWRLRMANIIPMLDRSDAGHLTSSRRPVEL